MTSICKIIVDSLTTLELKLTSVLALDDGLPHGSKAEYYALKGKIREILLNFTFFLPLSDCLNEWIVDKNKNLQSLAIQIQKTVEEAAKKVRPEDVDNVWREICEMTNEREPQAVQSPLLFWVKRQTNTPRRALLFDVLSQVNAKIYLLLPKIEENFSEILFTSHSKFGLKWLISSACSCLSEIDPESIGSEYQNILLKLKRNLSDLQIFFHGISDLLLFRHGIYEEVSRLAIRTLLLACRWWVRVYQGFTGRYDNVFNNGICYVLQSISSDNPKTLGLVLRLLKSLKAIDHSLFSTKVIEFAQYVIPNLIGIDLLTREIGSSTITISLQVLMEPKELKSILILLPLMDRQIFKMKNSWLPEDEPLMLNLVANACLMRIEAVFTYQIRYRGRFRYPFKTSGKWTFQFSQEWPEESRENVHEILKFLYEVALLQEAPDYCFPCPEAVWEFSVLLKVQFLKLKRELESCNGISKFSLKDKVQSLQDWSEFLINFFVRYRNNSEHYKKAWRKYEVGIESMVKTVVSSCNSFLNHHYISDEMLQSVDHIFSSLLDDITNIMAGIVKELCLPVRISNFPKTSTLGFYDILLGKVHELMNFKATLFLSLKQYIEELLVHLHFFRNFLGDYLRPERETQELRDLCGHILHVAYETEYLIDSILFSDITQWQLSICLYNLLLNMRHIKRQVSEVIEEKKVYDVKVQNIPQSMRRKVSKASTPQIDDDVLKDEQEFIIDRLLGGYQQRDIISIVGMPGIGKTTLAEKVYSRDTVVKYFHIRAWCCVGEVYQKRELLLEILSHIIGLTENILGKSEEDLEFKLRQLLLKQKYLIIIDDMWSTEAWNDLQISLPENENGSRILITSRSYNVDLKGETHYLRLLSDAECWALLQKKVFDKECCPDELIEVGQEIAKNCKGLPLAVVAMAGILKRTEKQENLWKEMAKDLSSQVFDDPHEQCRYILQRSYKFLPENLKACFLYFGAFPEDQEIPVTKLIRLWIAEGLVGKTELKSLEELAEDYLKDLIGRSLVIFAQPKSRGGPKACRVHDMLRYFCMLKAKEDNFLRLITMSNANDSSSSLDDLYFQVNDNFSNPSSHQTYEDYRLCFYSKRNRFIQSRPSGTVAHSLLFFAINDKYARSSYDISFIFSNFRRLKVLDLELINIGPAFPMGIEHMLLLKYLAVSGDVEFVPPSIANLSNLETFVLKGLKGKVNLPDTIWHLKRLRHVHVTDVAIMNLNGTDCLLYCLVTLSTLFLPYRDDTINMLKMLPNLRKLGCIVSESPDHFGSYNLFPRLDVLTQLESLKISYCGRALNAAEFIFPLSLKKLTLSNFRLPWSHISVIGRLQNLEVLKLLSRAYDGEMWDMVDGEFHNLKFLKLENLNVSKWNASSDSLPNLEKLLLRNCKHLEEVPSSFVEICTLKMIEVKWCGKSAEDSVRRMRDEADEFLNIIITSDFELSL